MNESHIKTALERRFARVAVPDVPHGPWRTQAAQVVRRRPPSRGFVYAAAVLGILLIAGVAQASETLRANLVRFMCFNGCTTPLAPGIHRADRLTIAQAQQRMPFKIVVPAGLPPDATFRYAHVVSEHPVPRVALLYQTRIKGRYYAINVNETTVASGPPIGHVKMIIMAKNGSRVTEEKTVPMRRWKHGDLIMEMLPWGLPPSVVDRIVRENTL